jgi:UPF0176 protein
MSQIVVCAMYKFVELPEYEALRQPLLDVMHAQQIRGTLLLAREGINGTVAGTQSAIDNLRAWLDTQSGLDNIDCKFSHHDAMPFNRCKVKLKKEIVTMGIEGIDPRRVVGTYVEPKDWNALISDPDVIVVDTRNDYEFGIGTFKNALNPNTETFREFPAYVKENLDPAKHKKVALCLHGRVVISRHDFVCLTFGRIPRRADVGGVALKHRQRAVFDRVILPKRICSRAVTAQRAKL